MRYHLFSVPALDSEDRLKELNAFLSSRRILEVDRQFVSDGARSYWSFCVSYTEDKVAKPGATAKTRKDYREILNEKDFAVYSKLRALRKELAEKEGVPPYALFTNEQLAEMVRCRMGSLTALGTIAGVGKTRTDKYGEAFLAILKTETAPKKTGTEDETNPH